jgi:hypothetical protein
MIVGLYCQIFKYRKVREEKEIKNRLIKLRPGYIPEKWCVYVYVCVCVCVVCWGGD